MRDSKLNMGDRKDAGKIKRPGPVGINGQESVIVIQCMNKIIGLVKYFPVVTDAIGGETACTGNRRIVDRFYPLFLCIYFFHLM